MGDLEEGRGERATRLKEDARITHQVIGAAIRVHQFLGPGLFESAYRSCLRWELARAGMPVLAEVEVPLVYRGWKIESGYRLDLLVADSVIVEVKAVAALARIHEAQLLTYLRLTGLRVGLLLNFNVPVLKDGIRRLVL